MKLWSPKLPRMSNGFLLISKVFLSWMAMAGLAFITTEIAGINSRSLLALISFAALCSIWLWMIHLTPEADRMQGECSCPFDYDLEAIHRYRFQCDVHGPAMRQELKDCIGIVDRNTITNEIIHDGKTWDLCRELIRKKMEERGH